MAQHLNIRKFEAILLSFLTVAFAITFPAALRGDKVLYWILGTTGLFFLAAGVMVVRNPSRAEAHNNITAEDPIEEPIEDQIEEDLLTEVDLTSTEVEEWGVDTPAIELVDEKEMSLEELIDKGFQAKEQGQFHLTADWFIKALAHRPSYDIAFYLIVETCKHWKNGSAIHDALAEVAPYIDEYMQNAPPEWKTQLLEWLETENMAIPRENIGRID